MSLTLKRGERLQIMLMKRELEALDDWRFQKQMPSRASAIRELLRRGLAAEGFLTADRETKSGTFGVVTEPKRLRPTNGNGSRVKGVMPG